MKKFRGNNKVTVIKPDFSNHKRFTLISALKDLVKKEEQPEKAPIANPEVAVIPSDVSMNHLAICIDGIVQEVMRAQNRMTAMLLSEPVFVEFNPEDGYPVIGQSRLVDGKIELKGEDENKTD